MMSAEAGFMLMVAAGDTLRRGGNPGPYIEKAQELASEAEVRRFIAEVLIPSWDLPLNPINACKARDSGDTIAIEWVMRRRDEVHSVTSLIGDPDGIVAAALAQKDLSCGGKVTRSTAEIVLGHRIELLDSATWLETVAWAPEPDLSDDARFPTYEEMVAAGCGRPSFDTTIAFVTEGHLPKFVARAAEMIEDFRVELTDAIETYMEYSPESVSEVARAWYGENCHTPT